MVNVLLATLYEEYIYQKEIIKNDATTKGQLLKRSTQATLKRHSIVDQTPNQNSTSNEINLQQLKSVSEAKSSTVIKNGSTSKRVRPRAMRVSVDGTQILNFQFLAKKSMKSYLYNIFTNDFFKFCMNAIVLGNGVILCLDRYPISDQELFLLNLLDFASFLIFFFEIHLKIFAFSAKIFFRKKSNFLEFLIVEVNTLQYLAELMIGLNPLHDRIISSDFIRGLKLARVFVMMYTANQIKSLRIIIRAFSLTLYKIRRVFFLMLIILLTMAFIGMDLFAFRVRYLPNFVIPESLYDL